METPQLTRIENRLDGIHDNLSEYAVAMAEMRKDVASNKDGLAEHMSQTRAVIARIEPLEEHVADTKRFFKRILWVIGGVISVAGPVINHLLEKLVK